MPKLNGNVICLRTARIVMAGLPPAYLRRALSDLRAQLPGTVEQPAAKTAEIQIELRPDLLGKLTRQGFLIQTRREVVKLTAAGWHGLNYAILDLVARLARSTDGCSIPAGLDLQERPSFRLRGIYGHTAWVYNHPFAVRSWRLGDWQRYIDLLAYLRVNLLQIWVPISIMAVPLSSADRDYLDMFRAVVDYAKEERGFSQVWVGAAANDVGLAGGSKTPVSLRQYYDRSVRGLRNPAVAAQMNDIVASRRALYETVPNADGYWIIDSDPGGWPGSSSEDFAKILTVNRSLVDQVSRRRKQAKLIYWIWSGWGKGLGRRQRGDKGNRRQWYGGHVGSEDREQNIKDTVQHWRRLTNGRPLSLLACRDTDLPLIADWGSLSKTVYFSYNVIEPEPNPPYTALRFAEVKATFAYPCKCANLYGVMGNVQTPLVQLPNIWLFSRLAWDVSYNEGAGAVNALYRPWGAVPWGARYNPTSAGKVLNDLARDIYPRIAAELAHAWRQLDNDNPTVARKQAVLLRKFCRSNQLGAVGALGRWLIPDGRWLVKNLAAQLDVHAAAMDMLAGLRRRTGYARTRGHAERYFQAAAKMMHTSGYFPATINQQGDPSHPFFNWYYALGDWTRIRAAWANYAVDQPRATKRMWRELEDKYAHDPRQKFTAGMIQFLVGDLPRRPETLGHAR